MGFKTYKKVFDLKSFQMSRTSDSAFYDPKMLSIRQLNISIDSLNKIDSIFISRSTNEYGPYLPFLRYANTSWAKSTLPNTRNARSFDETIPDTLKQTVYSNAMGNIRNIRSSSVMLESEFKERTDGLNVHKIEWHRKFTLSFACLVLFMIGAPLGSIIRKGGLGMPLVAAINFFVFFYLLNNFGEKLVKSGEWAPINGMWLSTAILIPVGLFLTYKAMTDSQLFNQEFYYRQFTRLRRFWLTLYSRNNTIEHEK
jgi:lipopolysaccharide export system permease protein